VSVSLSVLAPGVGIADHRTVLLEVDESPPQPRAGTGPSCFAYLMALCVQGPPDHSCTGPCDGLPMMLASIDWRCDTPGWGQAGCSGCVCRVPLVWASRARDTLATLLARESPKACLKALLVNLFWPDPRPSHTCSKGFRWAGDTSVDTGVLGAFLARLTSAGGCPRGSPTGQRFCCTPLRRPAPRQTGSQRSHGPCP